MAQDLHRFRTESGDYVFDVRSGDLAAAGNLRARPGKAPGPATAEGEDRRDEAVGAGPFPWPQARYCDAIPEIVLNTHGTCNLRCRYCYAHGSDEDYQRPPMTPEVARRAIDFLLTELGSGVPEVIVDQVLLGDPLLAPASLDGLEAYARQKAEACGKRLHWPRGATLNMTAGTAEDILSRFPEWIVASLDGPPEVHDAQRPFADGSGSYETVVGNLRRIMDSRRWAIAPSVQAQAALTAAEPDVTRIFLHLAELGVDGVSVRPIRLPPDHPLAIGEHNVGQVASAYTQFGDFLLAQRPDALLRYLRLIWRNTDFFGRFLFRILHRQKLPYRCGAGKWYVAVDTEGDLYPCTPFAGVRSYRLGSVFTGIDPARQQLWSDHLFIEKRPACRECWARYLCGGGCYYKAFLTNGHPALPDAAECILTRHVAEVALRVVACLQDRDPAILDAIPRESDSHSRQESPAPLCCARLPDADSAKGVPENWQSLDPLILSGPQWIFWKYWRGPDDLSAEVHLGWSAAHLHARVYVRDDIFVPPSEQTGLRAGDSLELTISSLSEPERRHSYLAYQLDGCSAVTACHDAPGAGLASLSTTRAWSQVRRDDGRTEYQLTIPWSELPGLAERGRFGLAICVHDDDGASRGYLRWPSYSGHAIVHLAGR